MEQLGDIIAAIWGPETASTRAVILSGLGATLGTGFVLVSLSGRRRGCRWRRDRHNRCRMPVWRCTRCGILAGKEGRRRAPPCGTA